MLLRIVRCAWASPASILGLLCVPPAYLGGGRATAVDGVLEVYGGLVTKALEGRLPVIGCCAAMTLGHVVIGVDESALTRTRQHERVHVRQYERWGPLFIPVYLMASLIARLRGRHPYLDNPFEIEAYRVSG